jgi:hypothetical protein
VLYPADGRQPQGAALDSARQNLASTFVNAFVNAGYGQDKLVTVSTEGQIDAGWCITTAVATSRALVKWYCEISAVD